MFGNSRENNKSKQRKIQQQVQVGLNFENYEFFSADVVFFCFNVFLKMLETKKK